MTEVAIQAINEAEGQSISAIIRNSLAECNLFFTRAWLAK
jgi:hypothetical protein